jgi:hypothetical protein
MAPTRLTVLVGLLAACTVGADSEVALCSHLDKSADQSERALLVFISHVRLLGFIVWQPYTWLLILRTLDMWIAYRISRGPSRGSCVPQERRMDLIHTAATQLDKHSMIKYDRRTGAFQATDLGRIASYYYITFNTLATFNEHLRPTMGDIELLRLFRCSSTGRRHPTLCPYW